MAQAPSGAQVQLAAGNDSRIGKEDRKESRASNDKARGDKDNAELLEEMRQMRQLIERLEARINQLEVDGYYGYNFNNGLTLDFGKFAGNLGYETNFTKDNFNYSRAYFFNFLPFYHVGLRAKYPVNDKLAVMYHLMNGVQQSEDFNKFKSQQVSVILTPTKKVTWQLNYYVGREQRDVAPQLNPTFASLPTQPGLSTDVIAPELRGRFHALDTYVTWLVTDNTKND